METRIQIKHLFDLGLNKPLAKDVLDLLIAEGRAITLDGYASPLGRDLDRLDRVLDNYK